MQSRSTIFVLCVFVFCCTFITNMTASAAQAAKPVQAKDGKAAATAQKAPVIPTTTVNKVVAVVNGEMITMMDLQKSAMPEIVQKNLTGTDAKSKAERDKIMSSTLDMMILDILARHEAERLKISISDQELDNEVRTIRERNRLSAEEFERQISYQGMDIDAFKTRMKNSMVRQRLVSMMVTRKIMINKDDVAAYYEAHKAEFKPRESVDISLIVFHPEVNPKEVLGYIKSGRMSFEDAAKKVSIEPAGRNGGGLGALKWGEINEQWKTIINKMQVGEISPVFPVDKFKAVIRLNKITEGKQLTLEEATPRIEDILRAPQFEERFAEYGKQLREKAVVEIRL